MNRENNKLVVPQENYHESKSKLIKRSSLHEKPNYPPVGRTRRTRSMSHYFDPTEIGNGSEKHETIYLNDFQHTDAIVKERDVDIASDRIVAPRSKSASRKSSGTSRLGSSKRALSMSSCLNVMETENKNNQGRAVKNPQQNKTVAKQNSRKKSYLNLPNSLDGHINPRSRSNSTDSRRARKAIFTDMVRVPSSIDCSSNSSHNVTGGSGSNIVDPVYVDEKPVTPKKFLTKQELYTDKDRAAAVVLGTRDIKVSLQNKIRREKHREKPHEANCDILLLQGDKEMQKNNPQSAVVFFNKVCLNIYHNFWKYFNASKINVFSLVFFSTLLQGKSFFIVRQPKDNF